jgi:hypothetical protein
VGPPRQTGLQPHERIWALFPCSSGTIAARVVGIPPPRPVDLRGCSNTIAWTQPTRLSPHSRQPCAPKSLGSRPIFILLCSAPRSHRLCLHAARFWSWARVIGRPFYPRSSSVPAPASLLVGPTVWPNSLAPWLPIRALRAAATECDRDSRRLRYCSGLLAAKTEYKTLAPLLVPWDYRIVP